MFNYSSESHRWKFFDLLAGGKPKKNNQNVHTEGVEKKIQNAYSILNVCAAKIKVDALNVTFHLYKMEYQCKIFNNKVNI